MSPCLGGTSGWQSHEAPAGVISACHSAFYSGTRSGKMRLVQTVSSGHIRPKRVRGYMACRKQRVLIPYLNFLLRHGHALNNVEARLLIGFGILDVSLLQNDLVRVPVASCQYAHFIVYISGNT